MFDILMPDKFIATKNNDGSYMIEGDIIAKQKDKEYTTSHIVYPNCIVKIKCCPKINSGNIFEFSVPENTQPINKNYELVKCDFPNNADAIYIQIDPKIME